jgi:hypothetical protein
MKLDIVKDERWPDYTINNGGQWTEFSLQCSPDTAEWITTTIKDYERVQKFIEELAKHQGVYK